jgi:hypothetical protein
MKLQPWVMLGTLATTIAAAGTDTFDSAQPGSPPTGYDGHISRAGSVGVWTKADSVTVFDDFSYGGT